MTNQKGPTTIKIRKLLEKLRSEVSKSTGKFTYGWRTPSIKELEDLMEKVE